MLYEVITGFVVREGCDVPSNFRSTMSLPAYLDQQGIVGIQRNNFV